MYGLPDSNDLHENHVDNEQNDLHEEKEKRTISKSLAQEEAPAEEENPFIPFSTRITTATFIKLKQAEYWERLTITEIVETALQQYLQGIPTATNPLPDKEQKRLNVRKLQTPRSSKKQKQ
ncbi:hypothetical protein BXP70_28385 [Hymenobacter crusticola]|uniref:Uncharacterized protein n=2 Tax=Hymenobacter crusticola TaxID=1770526 RepID=A0A243W555_9BACT|nr:hypothetical protein BXP70_28385 [Hymenobacter crusticola]